MKKIFAFAIAAVTMAVGCQKFQDILKPNNEPVDDGNPVEIKFSTNVATVEVKGVGAFDKLNTTQDLYIYGIATKKSDGSTKVVIENKKANIGAPAGEEDTWVSPSATGALKFPNNAAYFYSGTKDVHAFYGYYVDDACGYVLDDQGEPKEPKELNPIEPTAEYKLNITIDGTQDILLGKATPANDLNATVTTPDDVYSAWSARNGVTPNLVFDHALTQYTFEVKNLGTKDLALTGVGVTSKTKAVLTVAETQGLSEIGTGETADSELALTNTTGDLWNTEVYTYTTKQMNDNGTPDDAEDDFEEDVTVSVKGISLPKNGTEYVKIENASIMTFAAQKNNVVLYLKQEGMAHGEYRKITIPLNIAALGGKEATEAGVSYNVQISIYSLEQIEINVTLNEWLHETLVIDQDDLDNAGDANDGDYNDEIVPAA